MEIKPEQLLRHLERGPLRPIYLVWGEEPLQRMEAADRIRLHAHRQGYTERTVLDATETGFRWPALNREAASQSLFGTRKLIELRLGERGPGREGGPALARYAAAAPEHIVLLISAEHLDAGSRKTRWYQALGKTGITIPAWPVKAHALPEWLLKRARAQGLRLEMEAARMIAGRTEGNLLATRQELDRLVLLGRQTIEAEQILGEVADNTRFNVFDLIEAALRSDLNRVSRMLFGLQQEGIEPYAVFGALTWELQRIYALLRNSPATGVDAALLARHGIRGARQGAVKSFLRRCDLPCCYQLLAETWRCSRLLKSLGREEGWRELIWLFLKLGGWTPVGRN